MAQNGLFPVSFDRHHNRYWRRFTSYEFARGSHQCPIVITEAQQIAAAFPILFRRSESRIEPVALLSLSGAPTPFVSEQGHWRASYVPSALRCFPFQAQALPDASSNTAERFHLLVDEASGLVTDNTEDEMFFTDKGRLTPDLCAVRTFFQNRLNAATATQGICGIIEKMGLFKTINQYEGVSLPPDLLALDQERVEALSQSHGVLLMNSQALRLIHAHQVSLSHCAWLANAQQRRYGQSSQRESATNTRVTGFLNAMANAHQSESTYALR